MFTPYAQTVGHIPQAKELRLLLAEARKVLNSLSGISDCHTAAHLFVEKTGKGKVIRGYYFPNFEHSWVELGTYILDIYPVGGCQPHVIAASAAYHGPYIRDMVRFQHSPKRLIAKVDIKAGEDVFVDYLTALKIGDKLTSKT